MDERMEKTSDVRPEAPADHTGVYELNVAAFGSTVEARLVGMLHEQARPVVSLVAEEDGALAGHIMFTPVSLHGFERLMMGLAPMAVAPARQRRGIGSAFLDTRTFIRDSALSLPNASASSASMTRLLERSWRWSYSATACAAPGNSRLPRGVREYLKERELCSLGMPFLACSF
jgi:GNAT superfamily N-acetyltransferase